jgi:hypothetical protein
MWLLPAPRSAFFPAACVSLARRRRSSSSSGLARGPRIDRARVRLRRHHESDASAWPVAREVPAGWCTNPTGTLARGMGLGSLATSAIIPAVCFAPLSGCSRQRWRLVCVPLRHVLPIRGFRRRASDRPPSLPPLRPEGDRCSGPGFQVCDNPPPGAGPASPDIASSGVSEGGTGVSLRGWKWWGMKKCVEV